MTQPTARKKPGNTGKQDDLIGNLAQDASDAAEAIEERGAEVFDKVKAAGNDMFQKAKDTGGEQLDKLRDFVMANPLQCVAGGIAFGFAPPELAARPDHDAADDGWRGLSRVPVRGRAVRPDRALTRARAAKARADPRRSGTFGVEAP